MFYSLCWDWDSTYNTIEWSECFLQAVLVVDFDRHLAYHLPILGLFMSSQPVSESSVYLYSWLIWTSRICLLHGRIINTNFLVYYLSIFFPLLPARYIFDHIVTIRWDFGQMVKWSCILITKNLNIRHIYAGTKPMQEQKTCVLSSVQIEIRLWSNNQWDKQRSITFFKN